MTNCPIDAGVYHRMGWVAVDKRDVNLAKCIGQGCRAAGS